ncbi:MAG: membrane integrity-associated transporter subunit PqiC [Deltaproteobacteria bacterium]|nr:membrane integrity-associated transporter subunit PqiC [Deltaproteobacteria bacterium]MCW5801688.1 membrane integrity-associated transporter subunit PqiC [Deltaproteobacteria bacterium]
MKARLVAALAAASLLVSGCTVFRPSKPVEVHYFAPTAPTQRATAQSRAAGQGLTLRIGRVEPSPYLRERIAWRTSSVELGLYDTKRWTDTPDAYVRRALEHALFTERGVTQVTGHAPTLDVDITGFEELRHPRGARVELRYRLQDDKTVIATDVVTIDRPATGPAHGRDFSAIVVAIGAALDEAAERVADAIVQDLRRP